MKRNPSTNDWNYQWINVQKGLSNNCIKAISEDNNSFIWVATNKGLNRIDPQTLSVKIYQLNDGLANNEFSERAYIEKRNGTLYFGGINGITSFTPAVFTEDTILPKLSFVNLSINNKTLKVGEEVNRQILLERSILNTDKLTLSSRNNNFSFDFVALHFTSTDKIIYKYKLEGFDKEWITSEQGNRSAKYTNIPPGNYLFSVKASCNGETWSEPLKMEIQVLQPLLLRWYFILLYILISIFIVYMIIRNFKIREKRKNELFLAQKEKHSIYARYRYPVSLSEGQPSGKSVCVYEDGQYDLMDVEEYIESVLMGMMQDDWNEEMLKAMAVVLRTGVYYQMENQDTSQTGKNRSDKSAIPFFQNLCLTLRRQVRYPMRRTRPQRVQTSSRGYRNRRADCGACKEGEKSRLSRA